MCKNKCNYFKKKGHRYRRKHLNNQLKVAQKEANEEAETRILAIIQRKKDRALLRRLNYSMSKSYGRSARVVSEVSDDGVVTEHEGQDEVQNAMWLNIHDKRLIATKQKPVCQGRLRGEFGYQAASKSAKEVLDGTYEYAIDFDPSTKELMQECVLSTPES